ncbi:unnamed protein product [Rhizoctonia solani]|uniref:Superoxide dismutase n=1 Tax=Rhizoctonia solani TaxID=456999 RepID=A0A8H3HJY1_9AGAM|nr:unnamed protein product [Rhizoctonia solani]
MSKVTLPDLPYEYKALEPHISREIMELHHKKHHQTYVNGYNTAMESLNKLVNDPSTARQQIALQSAIKFNGGGHINHSLFWKNLAPAGTTGINSDGELETPFLAGQINSNFTTFKDFKEEFNAAALGIQGSGWAWLAWNMSKERPEIVTTANQDPLLPPYVPIFGVDMWEHAFYLQYKNVKPDYLTAIWNVINFHEAEKRLNEAVSSKL